MFGDSDPIDKQISIDGKQFSVIGVYHYTASPMGTPTSAGGGDSPKAIAPLETGRRHMNLWVRGNNLIVKPRDGVKVDAVDDVIAYLRGRRGLRPGDRTNFAVVTQDKLMDVYNQLFGTFFVVGIALSPFKANSSATRARRDRDHPDDLGLGAASPVCRPSVRRGATSCGSSWSRR